MPLPWGISFNYVFLQQPINIASMQLSVNDNPTEEVDFIEFEKVRSRAHTFTVRPDLWVLPFLNVYGIFGGAFASTKVDVAEPVAFTSLVEQGATTKGFGFMAMYRIKPVWIAADANFTWTDLEKLLEPLPGQIFSLRVGHNLNFTKNRMLGLWIGATYQAITAETNGAIALDEALPPDAIDAINEAGDQMCADSSRPAVCERILNQIRAGDPLDTTINYRLDKELAAPLNMILGTQYAFSKEWQARMEVGLIRRYSLLLSVNYRWGIRVR